MSRQRPGTGLGDPEKLNADEVIGGCRILAKLGSDPEHRYRTTYYRREFTVPNSSPFTTLDLNLMRDDGAVIYLNGREVARSNMPDGPISIADVANTVVGNADEERCCPPRP